MVTIQLLFSIVRVIQVVTLIPTWGILAWFVHQFQLYDTSPPASTLVLFIAALVGTAWALASSLTAHLRRSHNLYIFISFADLLVLIALITGVVFLFRINGQDYAPLGVEFETFPFVMVTPDLNPDVYDVYTGYAEFYSWIRKRFLMLRSAWALAILNCILWFFSALLALVIFRRIERVAAHERSTRQTEKIDQDLTPTTSITVTVDGKPEVVGKGRWY